MPAVNYQLMYQEMVDKVGGRFNQILYWSRLLDWKNQTLTPNPDVIYVMPFFDTAGVGPMVLEIPPADDGLFNGSIMNYWHAAIEDIGPGGLDKGAGAKYLFLPPDYQDPVPEEFIPMPSDTYKGYALIRSVLRSGSEEDVDRAVKYAERVRLYPLSDAGNSPQTTFVDAADVVFDSTIRYDSSFFDSLNELVQTEPWLERDKVMIDVLKTIGIERGRPFNPDATARAILDDAMRETHAVVDAAYGSLPPYYGSGGWFFPITEEMYQNVTTRWHTPDSFPIDARGTAYSLAFFSGMHVGENQYYLLCGTDRDGDVLDGSAHYRLHVPSGVPVTQYWSTTVYDRDTHAFIRNASRVGRSSQTPELQREADGSTYIYFGPTEPTGAETNWIPTNPNGRFEVLARFYGPKAPLFDKTWRLPDLERDATLPKRT